MRDESGDKAYMHVRVFERFKFRRSSTLSFVQKGPKRPKARNNVVAAIETKAEQEAELEVACRNVSTVQAQAQHSRPSLKRMCVLFSDGDCMDYNRDEDLNAALFETTNDELLKTHSTHV